MPASYLKSSPASNYRIFSLFGTNQAVMLPQRMTSSRLALACTKSESESIASAVNILSLSRIRTYSLEAQVNGGNRGVQEHQNTVQL